MNKLILAFKRVIFHNTFREIERSIMRIIETSHGKIDNLTRTNSTKPKSHWGSLLFSIFDTPPDAPIKIKTDLDKYSSGQNWEFFWSKACFKLISELPLKNYVEKLKQVIEKNHIWHSINAMEVLVQYPDFFKRKKNIAFIQSALKQKDDWAAIEYLKSLSNLSNNATVDNLLSDNIDRIIGSRTNQGYLQAFYVVKETLEKNLAIRNNYSHYLYDIANSYESIEENKYSKEFGFNPELKARSLMIYLKYNHKDENAQNFHTSWLVKEDTQKIKDILSGNDT